jgi:hypothetical protein
MWMGMEKGYLTTGSEDHDNIFRMQRDLAGGEYSLQYLLHGTLHGVEVQSGLQDLFHPEETVPVRFYRLETSYMWIFKEVRKP